MYKTFFKYFIDFSVSLTGLICISPVFIFVTICLFIANSGKPFFFQMRPGKNATIFKLIKFKTMNDKRDENGDLLPDVERLTKIGKFVRKTSLDEIPQLINVLKGDMSLVGPRPERRYYIDQIVKISPQYKLLLRVKPGVTSWGEVKYGYASSVEQMIERMAFDLQYIDNMSLSNDLKILLYTVATVLRGEGK